MDIRSVVNGRRVALLLTSHFTKLLFGYGQAKFGDNYRIDYFQFKNLLEDNGAVDVSLHYFTLEKFKELNKPSTQSNLLEWMERRVGYKVYRRPSRLKMQNEKTRYVRANFSVSMALTASELVNDYDVFILLDTCAQTAEITAWLAKFSKIIITGNFQTVNDHFMEKGTNDGSHEEIDFSTPSMLEYMQRKSFDKKEDEILDGDEDASGLQATLRRTAAA